MSYRTWRGISYLGFLPIEPAVVYFQVFRALFRHDNILLHIVYDYFGEEDFTKACNELGTDTSHAKHVSISRLNSSMFDNFWSECV